MAGVSHLAHAEGLLATLARELASLAKIVTNIHTHTHGQPCFLCKIVLTNIWEEFDDGLIS